MGLLERIRGIKTLGDGTPVYANAKISLERVNPIEAHPTAKYVLKGNLKEQMRIKKELEKRGINTLSLNDIVQYGEDVTSPPVLEREGDRLAIVDGIHRMFVAKQLGVAVNAIVIEGSDPSRPSIGQTVSWSDVKVRGERPTDPKQCRDLKPGISDNSEDLKKHYRDFSGLGSRGRRPSKGQNG